MGRSNKPPRPVKRSKDTPHQGTVHWSVTEDELAIITEALAQLSDAELTQWDEFNHGRGLTWEPALAVATRLERKLNGVLTSLYAVMERQTQYHEDEDEARIAEMMERHGIG